MDILNTVTIKDMIPDFVDYDNLPQLESEEYLRRIDFRGQRYYYKIVGDEVKYYLSVTTFLKRVMPPNHFLDNWKLDVAVLKGEVEAPQEYAETAAHYGTILHIVLSEFLKKGRVGLIDMHEILHAYFEENMLMSRYQDLARYWFSDLKNDMLSLAQWIEDYNFKPLAIEYAVSNDEMGTGGLLDLVGYIDYEEKGFFGEVYKTGVKKGEPKETKRTIRPLVLVDLKSGQKGFYESQEAQLEIYKRMWNAKFEGTPYIIERIFNIAPKTWRTKPTYSLKDQTNTKQGEVIDSYLALGKALGVYNVTKTFKQWNGDIVLGEDLAGVYSVETLSDLIIEKDKKRKDANRKDQE